MPDGKRLAWRDFRKIPDEFLANLCEVDRRDTPDLTGRIELGYRSVNRSDCSQGFQQKRFPGRFAILLNR
jgi:hypothetical protein